MATPASNPAPRVKVLSMVAIVVPVYVIAPLFIFAFFRWAMAVPVPLHTSSQWVAFIGFMASVGALVAVVGARSIQLPVGPLRSSLAAFAWTPLLVGVIAAGDLPGRQPFVWMAAVLAGALFAAVIVGGGGAAVLAFLRRRAHRDAA